MEHKKVKNKEQDLLFKLGSFSKNMSHNHHLDNLSEFIVHDLCAQDTFNITKAAYFVNNPDFTCLKGVAGYYHPESFKKDHSWNRTKEFTKHMKASDFNQKVRAINDQAFVIDGRGSEQAKVQELMQQLNMKNPMYHTWIMKYDNQGLFIFEQPEMIDGILQDHLLNFLHMLSFCPIF